MLGKFHNFVVIIRSSFLLLFETFIIIYLSYATRKSDKTKNNVHFFSRSSPVLPRSSIRKAFF